MKQAIVGKKLDMVQQYNAQGLRLVVTRITVDQDQKLSFFQDGDLVEVTGWSKGKGFTGVMKKWGFKGGPRTHGQSDRQRAPGSIGQGTDPGRVFLGKKMPGRAGNQRTTIKGLRIFRVDQGQRILMVTGLVPGPKSGKLLVKKSVEKRPKTKPEASKKEKPVVPNQKKEKSEIEALKQTKEA